MMKYFILILAIIGLYGGVVQAQAPTGYYVRTDCDGLSTPVSNGAVCLQTTTTGGRTAGRLYVWTGAAWTLINASSVSVDSTTLTGTGTDAQAVFEELDNTIDDHIADTVGAHAGTAISNTPAGNIAATTVQAAINELDGEKQPLDTDLTTIGGLADPNADRILFWDDSAGAYAYLAADGTTVAISNTTFGVVADSITATQIDETDDYTWTGTHTFTGATVAMNHDQLSELDDDDHSATYVKYESTAGPPPANSCERDGQIQFDTTNNRIYMCPSTGATPIDVGTQSDSYTQVSDGTYAVTAVGSETLTVAGSDIVEAHAFALTAAFTNQPAGDGVEIVSTSASDVGAIKIWGYRTGKSIGALTSESITLQGVSQSTSVYTDWQSLIAVEYPSSPVGVITVREASGNATITTLNGASRAADRDVVIIDGQARTKSVYFPAGALTTDGTQCATPALATINSGIRTYTILCADNDASTIWGSAVMPDSWNGGTVTFELSYVQTAADTAVMNSDISAQCRPAGGTINSTFGTEVAIDDAAVSGSNIVDMTTSGAVTPNGTCAGGDMLNFKWQLDAGGTTTAVATLHILGIKMEYGVTTQATD